MDDESPSSTSPDSVSIMASTRTSFTRVPTAPTHSAHDRNVVNAPNSTDMSTASSPLEVSIELGKSSHTRRRSLMSHIDTSKLHSKAIKNPIDKQNYTKARRETLDCLNLESPESGSSNEEFSFDYQSDDDIQDDEEAALNGKEKKKVEQKKRRNTLLDRRVSIEPKVTDDEKRAANQHVLRKSLINVLLIALWYIFSLSISVYNKWMFDSEHLDFHFPLFTTCLHMIVQFCLSSLVLYFLPQFRPRHDSISNPQNISHTLEEDSMHHAEIRKPLMTRMFYFTRIGPCGVATGLDIGLGNMSLKFITLTFYTMCKSSSLSFVLLFAFLFRLENPSIRLILIIITMTFGVLMMVAGETTFSPLGFILVIFAAFFSGFRWALTQILLLRNPATSNPFSSIFFLAPMMFTSLFLLAIPVEGFANLWAGFQTLVDQKGPILGPLLLLFPGTIAFCMTASEFALLQRTSVVTLSIAGIFKEVITITVAGLIFHDPLTATNIIGLIVTMAAIAAYNYIKIRHMRKVAQEELRKVRLEE